MKGPSDNLLARNTARRKLPKHVREVLGTLRRDGIAVAGVYARAAGHFDVEVVPANGEPVRVGMAGTPSDRNAMKHTLRAARKAAGR